MELSDSIILGLVQGLTEFIPVSSSGHLVLVDALSDVSSSFELDVLLNIGTVGALLVYFWRRLVGIVLRMVQQRDFMLARNIIVSTIPAVIIGGLFSDFFEKDVVRNEYVVAVSLAVVGVAMVTIDKLVAQKKSLELNTISWPIALRVGLAQVLALVPGTSRSGVTMLASRAQGLRYSDAAEYSFLLAIPILSGAVLRTLLSGEARDFIAHNASVVGIGIGVAFISGLVAISFTMQLINRYGLKYFGYYRIVLAIGVALTLVF